MANQEHLKILKKGVKVWNQWRSKNLDDIIICDLSKAHLSKLNLSGVNFSGVNLEEANLGEANLKGAILEGANFRKAHLAGANLSKCDLSGVNLEEAHLGDGANLEGANLERANFRKAILGDANLKGANLKGKDLSDEKLYLGGADLSGANLSGANLSGKDFSNINLSKANLSRANLSRANLTGVDISGFDFSEANLSEQNLSGKDLSGKDLSRANLSRANLSGANLSGANLSGANLSGANLSGANLRRANLSEVNISGFDFSRANFSGADLSKTQVLGTNFTAAIFTGACLEDWNINSTTNLSDVICDHIYLRQNQQERRPSDITKNFAPGDFTKLLQKAQETVDLIFADGIDWKAFLLSLQELRNKYGEENLSVQAIEKKSNNAFVIRLEVPLETDKAEIESQAKALYEKQLKTVEARYHTELQVKDEQIVIYRQNNTRLENIIYLLANRPIKNIIDVTTNDLRNAQIAGGLVNADTVNAHQIGGNINNYTPQQIQNLTQAAAEIQQLLQQLEQTNPTTTTSEKMTVVAKAVDEIEKNPTLKARVIGALKSGGKEALKEAIDHPLVNILIASIEGWQEALGDFQ